MADTIAGNEFLRMQNDAINRVRQMQRRADSFVAPKAPEQAAAPVIQQPAQPQRAQQSQQSQQSQRPQRPTGNTVQQAAPQTGGMLAGLSGGNSPISGILDSLFNGETDKLLILGLIWLLSKEKGDQMLIMALIYILM